MKTFIKFFALVLGVIMMSCNSHFSFGACSVSVAEESYSYIKNQVDLEKALKNKSKHIFFCNDIYLKKSINIDYSTEIDLRYFKIYVDNDFTKNKDAVIVVDGEKECDSSDLPIVTIKNGVIFNKNPEKSPVGRRGRKGMDTIKVCFSRLRLESCSVYGGNGSNGGDCVSGFKTFLFLNKNGGNGGDGGSALILEEQAIVEVYNSWLFGGDGGNAGNSVTSKTRKRYGRSANGGNGGSAVVINEGFLEIICCMNGGNTKIQAGNGGKGGDCGSNNKFSGNGGNGGNAIRISKSTYSKIEGESFAELIPGTGGASDVLRGQYGMGIQDAL